jgi:hypothetical protein
MAKLCEAKIPARWARALESCKTGIGRYLIVRAGYGYRERIDLTGGWLNTAPGWPVCDIGAHAWRITQTGRKVTASWRHGNGDQRGEFTGIFVNGDQAGDDRVQGTFTITDGSGAKVGAGSMTFAVNDGDDFDFNGSGVGGKMKRQERTTQGRAGAVALPARCRRPGSRPVPPASQAGSFVLASTKVTNGHVPELKVDAAGGKARWDHTGPFGGAGKGGEWKVDFTFAVPRTLTPGKSFSVRLGLSVSNVLPEQPLAMAIGARAPDFVGRVDVNYPNPASGSKTFSVPLSAGYKDVNYKEIVVIVGFVSAEVTYVYRRA